MLIEEGKYYVSRDGRVWGPMRVRGHGKLSGKNLDATLSCVWFMNGQFDIMASGHTLDLIREASRQEIETPDPKDLRVQDYTVQLFSALINTQNPELQEVFKSMNWDQMIELASSLAEKIVKGVK